VQKDDANFVNSDPDVGVNKHCDADVKPNSDSNDVGTGSIPDPALGNMRNQKLVNAIELETSFLTSFHHTPF